MDLLYIVGPFSGWADNELRYSLRSVARHLPHERLVIVGHLPAWVRGAVHVPAWDIHEHPVANTLHKLQVAVESGVLGEHFLLMNDDFLLLRDMDADDPAVVCGTLQQRITQGPIGADPYYDLLNAAMRRLRKAGIEEPLNYDVHAPLPMHCTGVRAMLKRWGRSGALYAWRSVYGNMNMVPAQLGVDRKQRHVFRVPEDDEGVMSPGEAVAQLPAFQAWCAARWPVACAYEG